MAVFPVTIPPGKPDAPTWLGRVHGIKCWWQDGQYLADSPAAQALIDGYDPLPGVRERLKARLEAERQTRVMALAGDQAQRDRLQSRMMELLLLAQQGTVTDADRAEMAAMHARWQVIKQIDAAADLIAADVNGMSDVAAMAAFDPAVSARWPSPEIPPAPPAGPGTVDGGAP